MKQQVAWFLLIDQDLYRCGYTLPLLKCITLEQATYVMRKIHEGVCGTHSGARTMATTVLREGYYWLTVQGDCTKFV